MIRREAGILKRMRATPLPAATYLAAVLVSTLLVFALQMLVTIALGVALYDAQRAERSGCARRSSCCSARRPSPGSGSGPRR